MRVIKPRQTVYSIKRFIGRSSKDISEEEMLVTYPIIASGSGPLAVEIHGRRYLPEEVSAEVLKKLRQDAETYFGEPITRAVITVPATPGHYSFRDGPAVQAQTQVVLIPGRVANP